MEGDGTAVAMNKYHNKNPAVEIPSICLIDGDSKQAENAGEHVYRLPGEAPESYVFDSILDSWASVGGKLAVALLQRFENADKVKEVCITVRRSNMDTHLLFAQVGEQLGLVPESTVSAAFANIWAQANAQSVEDILKPIRRALSKK